MGLPSKKIGDDRFLFQIQFEGDMKRVMWRSPWAFDRNLVILRPIAHDEVPELVNLDVCDFYVQITGLPISCIHKKMAEFVGNSMGLFVAFDGEDHKGANGSVMRIRVTLNITKPLLRVLNIEGPNDRVFQLHLTYEKLPNFCYFCGKIGHLVEDCSQCFDIVGENDRIDDSKLAYGDWLRARQITKFIGGSSSRPPPVSSARSNWPRILRPAL